MKTSMKKLMATMMAVMVAVAMFAAAPVTAKAATVVVKGSCGPAVKYTIYDNGNDKYTVEITGSGVMDNWGDKESPFAGKSSAYKSKITTVTVGEGVLSIGSNAFNGCSSLYNVYLPEGLLYINNHAFNDTGIMYIKLPFTVESIGDSAIPTDNMNFLTLPKNLKFKGNLGTSRLKDVYYPGTEEEFDAISQYVVNGIDFKAMAHYNAVDPMYDTYGPDQGVSDDTNQDGSDNQGFTDVPANAYFKNAVEWAVSSGVTSGTSATTFGPGEACTRSQVMTFLWKANGSGSGVSISFNDVNSGAYYYNAVSWAVANDVTSGTSAVTFGSNDACTRAQAMVFLWRAAGSPKASASVSFSDVSSSAYYYQAVQWAVSKGITSGTSATTFGSNDTCTRAQIITFLYKAMN